MNKLSIVFLSCLYGSQLYGKDAPAHYNFLSCLYGSQQP